MDQFAVREVALVGVYAAFGAAFWLVQRIERTSYLRLFALAQALFALHSLTNLWLLHQHEPVAVGRALGWAAMLGAGLGVLGGSYAVVGRALPTIWFFLGGIVGLLVPLVLYWDVAEPWRRLPTLGFMGLALLTSGAVLFSGRALGAGRWAAALGCWGGGFYALIYPFVRPWVAATEFVLDLGFALLIATGIIVMHFELGRESSRELVARYRSLFDEAWPGLFRLDEKGRVLCANRALLELLRCSEQEASKLAFAADLLVDADERVCAEARIEAGQNLQGVESRWRRRDGSEARVTYSVRSIPPQPGDRVAFEGSAQDVTHERRLRQQGEQAARLESLDRLAGGIAHDFNNALTIIMHGLELTKRSLPGAHQLLAAPLDSALEAARGAAKYTHQLMMLGRRRPGKSVPIPVNDAVSNALRTAQSSLGPHIALSYRLARENPSVCLMPGQLEQLVMNLLLNAGDAMPEGGELAVGTSVGELSPGVSSVRVTVSDTGRGMDDETRLRAFDPFFTTKAGRKGAGLGLTTVYGIVQQANGRIELETAPGQGSTFTIEFPRSRVEAVSERAASPVVCRGEGVILLVDDRQGLRDSTARALREAGYDVVSAASAQEALELAQGRRIDLLLTDVVMPRVTGPELADELRRAQPSVRILYMSGYAEDAVGGWVADVGPLLAKPFTIQSLTTAVAEVLQGAPAE